MQSDLSLRLLATADLIQVGKDSVDISIKSRCLMSFLPGWFTWPDFPGPIYWATTYWPRLTEEWSR